MRKRKTPAAANKNIKTLQLVIDGEILEKSAGWQNCIVAFSAFIEKFKPSAGINESFQLFRESYLTWYKEMKNIDPDFNPAMAEGEEFHDNSEIMSDEEFQQYIEENYSIKQEYIDAGYFVQQTTTGVRPDGSIGEINKMMVTMKGYEWLKEQLKKDGLIK